jgi:cation diffusion facilitator family transporter
MDATSSKPAIYVPFVLTKRGKRTLKFAGDLARLLDRDLVALVKKNKARDAFAKEAGMPATRDSNLVRETVIGLTGVSADRCSIEENSGSIPKGSIRVTSEGKNWKPDSTEATFFSADETGLFNRGKGPLYITVGNKWTHSTSIKEAVELAKTLGVPVILYHSTWRIPHNNSEDPRDHISWDAHRVLSSAVKIARDSGVSVEVVVEHATTITDGVLRHAIENSASAIMMIKSDRARRGSYVDQVVVHSPVPVFVAPHSNDDIKPEDLPLSTESLPFLTKQAKIEPPKYIAYRIMACVFMMYLIEVVSKLAVGSYLNSPLIMGDGWHNVSDIFQVIIVVVTIYLANQPTSSHYPYGWKNLEHLFGVLVGFSLAWAGLHIFSTSISSIFTKHEALRMGPQYFPWAVGVMSLAVVMSFVVGKMEIRYGTKYGYPSIVADGEETISDGRIAIAALVGIISEYLFNMPQIEYFLGTIISGFILHASYKITLSGVKGLLQHSIGDEKEEAIKKIVLSTRGVFEIVKLQSFITGSSAVVDLRIVSKVLRSHQLRVALKSRVEDYCTANGFITAECHVEFEGPYRPSESQIERVAFAALASPSDPYLAIVAPSLGNATHIVSADDERYSGRRSFIEPMPENLGSYCKEKHIKKLCVYGSVSLADAKSAEDAGVLISPVSTYCLETLGA